MSEKCAVCGKLVETKLTRCLINGKVHYLPLCPRDRTVEQYRIKEMQYRRKVLAQMRNLRRRSHD